MVGSEYFTAIAQPRDKTLIRLSKTTHNLFTFKASEISSNNSEKAYWQINTSSHFSYSLLIQFKLPNVHSHGRQTRKDPVFTASLGPGYQNPVSKARDMVVTLEERTISYLSVSARIENTVRYWPWTTQSLRILLTLSHLKYKLLNGTNYYLLDREFWLGTEKHPARSGAGGGVGGGGGGVRKSSNLQILSSATSTQTHNHETTPQKCHISKQHSKQAKRGREVERNYKIPANPVFINPGLNGTVLKFDLRYGAPQGSCLGLLLFTVQRTV